MDAGDKPGSPPQDVRSIGIGNLEHLCGELAKICTAGTLRKMKELALEKGNKEELVSKLDRMLRAERVDEEDICSDWVRFYVLVGELHPAKSHPELFSKDHAHIATTYQWTLGLGKKKGLLSKLQGLHRELRIFLDVLFIDQLSNNVVMNLAKAQEIYGLLLFHVAIAKGGAKLLDRGWCVFEFCLRERAGLETVVIGDGEELGFQGAQYDYYGNMKLSFDADKEQIDYALRMTYGFAPGGVRSADGQKINSALVKQLQTSRLKALPQQEDQLPLAILPMLEEEMYAAYPPQPSLQYAGPLQFAAAAGYGQPGQAAYTLQPALQYTGPPQFAAAAGYSQPGQAAYTTPQPALQYTWPLQFAAAAGYGQPGQAVYTPQPALQYAWPPQFAGAAGYGPGVQPGQAAYTPQPALQDSWPLQFAAAPGYGPGI